MESSTFERLQIISRIVEDSKRKKGMVLTAFASSLFISLQIKEFRIIALLINDSLYSCLFFFLTALHFFHLLIGLFILSLLFWISSLSFRF